MGRVQVILGYPPTSATCKPSSAGNPQKHTYNTTTQVLEHTVSQSQDTSAISMEGKMQQDFIKASREAVAGSSLHPQAFEDRKRLLMRSLPTCNICGKRFLRLGFLKRHKERKHYRNRDKRVYKCEFCPKVCRTAKDIKLHRRRHTGKKSLY